MPFHQKGAGGPGDCRWTSAQARPPTQRGAGSHHPWGEGAQDCGSWGTVLPVIPMPHSLSGSRCGVSPHTIPSGLCSWVSPLEQQVLSKASGFQGRRGEQTPMEETDPAPRQSDCSSIREKLCGVRLPVRTDIEGRPQVTPRSPRRPWPAARPQGSPRCTASWLPAGPRA